jgi:putative phage-type endonuclease
VSVISLDARRSLKLGGSEAASAVGVDPFRSRLMLWAEKTGRIERHETEAMRWGRLLEPVIYAELERSGFELVPLPDAEWSHKTLPWLAGHPDGFTVVDGGRAVLEVKTAGQWSAADWHSDAGAPLAYLVQAFHYMALTGCGAALLACLIGGQRLVIRTVYYEPALAERILEGEARFIEHLRTDTPPPPDGSDSARDAVRGMHPSGDGKTVRLDQATWAQVRELRARREQRKTIERQEAELEQAIQLAMGDAEHAISPYDTPAARWSNVQATRLDTSALRAARPDVYAEFAVSKQTRRFTLE